MKKILPIFVIALAFLCFSFQSRAQLQWQNSLNTNVQAKVGQFHLTVSGFISPYASIIMTSEGIFLRATVADSNGLFSFVDVLINKGFSHFCLEAIDFRRLGTSYTCFNLNPAVTDIVMKDVFLPPTLGLSRTEIAENSPVTAFGYTMPRAKVTLHLSTGKILTTIADKTGYYQFKLQGLKAGVYQLYATAEYNHKQSLVPSRKIELKSLSWWDQLVAFLQDLWRRLMSFLTSIYLNPLWLIVPILIFIIILILKLWPERFPIKKLRSIFPWRKKKLHHAWFIGY